MLLLKDYKICFSEIDKNLNMKNIDFLRTTTCIQHKIYNFISKHFYTKALAYEEFLKLAPLQEKNRVIC